LPPCPTATPAATGVLFNPTNKLGIDCRNLGHKIANKTSHGESLALDMVYVKIRDTLKSYQF